MFLVGKFILLYILLNNEIVFRRNKIIYLMMTSTTSIKKCISLYNYIRYINVKIISVIKEF